MKITFVSNYINHHQIPFSKAMSNQADTEYTFIQTEKMESERAAMGWNPLHEGLDFVKCYYEEPDACKRLIDESDVVIFGGTDNEDYILGRIESGKPVIRYSERIYKEGQWKFISPRGLKKKYHDHIRFRNNNNVVMLCAGGYVASDFSLIHAYPGKLIRWGYFPEFIDIEGAINSNSANDLALSESEINGSAWSQIISKKQKTDGKPVNILWAGRQIDWKHPEEAVKAARLLKEKGRDFSLTMIGDGPERPKLEKLAADYGLTQHISFIDFMKPQEVRRKMLESQIYLFTSDQKEGWGAVLNEAMNSAVAVVASDLIGATPYLIKHNENGLVYKSGNVNELADMICQLVDNESTRVRMGVNAYKTIKETWNADNAAGRLRQFIDGFVKGEITLFDDEGPVSLSPVIKPSEGYRFTRRKV